jgi:hypothetical protein
MRKMMLLAVMVAMAAMMLAAAPAMAADRDGDGHDDDVCDKNDEFCEDFFEFFEEFCEDFDKDLICDFEDFDNDFVDFADGITQETEQSAESGDVWQSFDVWGSGDNSNQCVGVQGVANTGNAQNTINVFSLGGEDVEFEFDEVGSTIDVSPINTTTCEQAVNQAATAYGGYDYGYDYYGGGYYW